MDLVTVEGSASKAPKGNGLGAQIHLKSTPTPRVAELFGTNFTDYTCVQAQNHFGIGLPPNRGDFMRVPWPEKVLTECDVKRHVLMYVPPHLSVRMMMSLYPQRFRCRDLSWDDDCFGWTSPQPRYCLANTRAWRHLTGNRVDETPLNFQLTVYLLLMGALSKRPVHNDIMLTVHDHNGDIAASVSYADDGAIIIEPHSDMRAKMYLYERAPHLS